VDNYVELYTNGDHWLGQFDPAQASGSYDAFILAIAIRSEQILIDWEGSEGGNRTFWSAHLAWDGSRIVTSQMVPHTGAASTGLWSDLQLTITPKGLGAVSLGMSQQQAEYASGLFLGPIGDGYIAPEGQLPTDFQFLYVTGWPVRCVGVNQTFATSPQHIVTTAGFALGESVGRLRHIYGGALKYVPAPENAGYVLAGPEDDYLVFFPNPANTKIEGIAAGRGITPNVSVQGVCWLRRTQS
jgi:hypothetical protein